MKFVTLLVGLAFCLLAYQNCAPVHDTLGSGDEGSLVTPSVQSFKTNLRPMIDQNCASCHGTSQQPLFGVADDQIAHDTLISANLINEASPASSRLVTKLNSGHQGYSTTEGAMFELAINNWIRDKDQGGGGTPTPTPTATPTPSAGTFTEVNAIIQASCIGCHNAGSAAGGVDYSSHAQTIATGGVVPNNSLGSSMYFEVNDGSMPQGAGPLSAAQINIIRTWIDAGALNN